MNSCLASPCFQEHVQAVARQVALHAVIMFHAEWSMV